MKAHIYCRSSTSEQYKSNSRQINKCVDFCRNNNLEIAYVYEESMSSRKLKNKKTLDDIIKNMDSGDILIVPSVDRFSRHVLGGLKILDKMEENELQIYSIDDRIGYSDIYDRHSFRDRMSHAELESDRTSKRVKNSMNRVKFKPLVLNKFKDDLTTDNVVNLDTESENSIDSNDIELQTRVILNPLELRNRTVPRKIITRKHINNGTIDNEIIGTKRKRNKNSNIYDNRPIKKSRLSSNVNLNNETSISSNARFNRFIDNTINTYKMEDRDRSNFKYDLSDSKMTDV